MERRSFLKASIAGLGLTLLPEVALAAPGPRITAEDVAETRRLLGWKDYEVYANDYRQKIAELGDKGSIHENLVQEIVVGGRRTGMTEVHLVVALTYARKGIPTAYMSESKDSTDSHWFRMATLAAQCRDMKLFGMKMKSGGCLSRTFFLDGKLALQFVSEPSVRSGAVKLDHVDQIVRDHHLEPVSDIGKQLAAERQNARDSIRPAYKAYSFGGISVTPSFVRSLEASQHQLAYIDKLTTTIALVG